jgi:Zn finger protein HypA/HybF involved in hydrogenase expression
MMRSGNITDWEVAMADIKPIETYYNGYRFRSRLEARWAVFFDAMGIKYQYEPEGYDLGDGVYYLPDFYLPEMKQFFEVKADINAISTNDMEKIIRLANQTGKNVIVGDGFFNFAGNEPDEGHRTEKEKYDFWGCDTYLVRCRECKTLYFENEMSYRCTACGYYDGDSTFDYLSDRYWDEYPEYIKAINAAKQARFEHGETPTI